MPEYQWHQCFFYHFSTHSARVILMRDTLKDAQVIILCKV